MGINQNKRGFTLTEAVVTIGILGLIIEGLYLFINQGYKNWRASRDQAEAQDNGRMALEKIVDEIKEIQNAETGAYGVEEAMGFSFIFYSNVDNDSDIERVRYFLDGTEFKKGVKDFVNGSYQDEIVYQRAKYIRNTENEPIFTYYDSNGSLTEEVTAITQVHIKIVVDYDPHNIPASITLETEANLRNKRQNL